MSAINVSSRTHIHILMYTQHGARFPKLLSWNTPRVTQSLFFCAQRGLVCLFALWDRPLRVCWHVQSALCLCVYPRPKTVALSTSWCACVCGQSLVQEHSEGRSAQDYAVWCVGLLVSWEPRSLDQTGEQVVAASFSLVTGVKDQARNRLMPQSRSHSSIPLRS